MSSAPQLIERSGGRCVLCTADDGLEPYRVAGAKGYADADILLCETCRSQRDSPANLDSAHWYCLTDHPEHIEGRVEGQRILILAKFVQKAGRGNAVAGDRHGAATMVAGKTATKVPCYMATAGCQSVHAGL